MGSHPHPGIHGTDDAVRVDQVGDAARPADTDSHETDIPPYPVSLQDGLVAVAQQGIGEPVFSGELAQFFRWVGTDPDDLDFPFLELAELVTEPLRFKGSPRGAGPREEPQGDRLSPEVGQAEGVAVLVLKNEFRRWLTYLEHK